MQSTIEPKKNIKFHAYILFMDIQGYSKLNNEDQLKLVNSLYKNASAMFGENEDKILDSKTIGDCFIIYFSDQNACIKSAYNIKTLFIEKLFWNTNNLKQLKCRISLHNGDLFLLDDHIEGKKALFGKSITTAARLEPVVRPNEVWCSNAFHEASKDNDIDRVFKFEDIGFCELAKNWGESKVYALFKEDDGEKPKKIEYEYKEKLCHFPDRDFPHTSFILIRLMNKHSGGTQLLETIFKLPEYSIDATYYIYGDYDVLMKSELPRAEARGF